MMDNGSKGISYTAGFFMLILFTVAGLVLAELIYGPLWTAMTGKPLSDLADGNFGPADTNALRVRQLIISPVGLLLPTLATAFLLHHKPLQLMGFGGRTDGRQVLLVLAIMLLALFVSSALAYVNYNIPVPAHWREYFESMELDYNKRVEYIVRLDDVPDFLIGLLLMAFIPAFCEEAMFRGGLQNFLNRGSGRPWLAILVVSLLFSLVHFSYYGFLSRLFLGVVLGLIYHYSGRLWLSILAHFFNNAFALGLLFYFRLRGKPIAETINETNGGWWGIIFLPLLIFLFVYFKKKTARHPAPGP